MIAAALMAAWLAGCGGSSHQATSTSTPVPTGPPVSKSIYQARAVGVLRPMLGAINTALRTPRQPVVWQQLQRSAADAYQTIGKLSPPPAISEPDRQLVRQLGDVASTAGALYQTLRSGNLSGAAPLGHRLINEGHQITSLGNQLKAQGYNQVGTILAGP